LGADVADEPQLWGVLKHPKTWVCTSSIGDHRRYYEASQIQYNFPPDFIFFRFFQLQVARNWDEQSHNLS
jgi:hypothetical protein